MFMVECTCTKYRHDHGNNYNMEMSLCKIRRGEFHVCSDHCVVDMVVGGGWLVLLSISLRSLDNLSALFTHTFIHPFHPIPFNHSLNFFLYSFIHSSISLIMFRLFFFIHSCNHSFPYFIHSGPLFHIIRHWLDLSVNCRLV